MIKSWALDSVLSSGSSPLEKTAGRDGQSAVHAAALDTRKHMEAAFKPRSKVQARMRHVEAI